MNTDAQPPNHHTVGSLPLRDGVRAGGLLLLAYLALRLEAPHIGFLPLPVATTLATLAFLLLSLSLVAVWASLPLPWFVEAVGLLLCVGAWLAAGTLENPLLSDCALVLGAIPFGRLLARGIRDRNLLVPVGAVAAVVDVWGVNLGGPVAQALQSAPQTAARLVTHVPSFGAPQFVAVVGLGDFVFTALFFACVAKFALDFRPALIGACVLAVIGLFLAVRFFPLPGLPFIALGVLLPNRHRFHFAREERQALAVGAAFLLVCLGAATLFLHNHNRAAKQQSPHQLAPATSSAPER